MATLIHLLPELPQVFHWSPCFRPWPSYYQAREVHLKYVLSCYSPAQNFPMLPIWGWAKVLRLSLMSTWPANSWPPSHLPLWPSLQMLSLWFTVLSTPSAFLVLAYSWDNRGRVLPVWSAGPPGSSPHHHQGPIQILPCYLKCHLLISIPRPPGLSFLSLLYFYARHLSPSDILYIVCIVNSVRRKIWVCFFNPPTPVSSGPGTVLGIESIINKYLLDE